MLWRCYGYNVPSSLASHPKSDRHLWMLPGSDASVSTARANGERVMNYFGGNMVRGMIMSLGEGDQSLEKNV
jgi:hypothetical protein